MRHLNFLLFLLIFLVSSFTYAQDASRGRLPDGRAYRLDASGNQLVDYIAELEVNVDALKRRVQGLEYELGQKQQIIDRLKSTSGFTSDTALKERDLLGSQEDQKEAPEFDEAVKATALPQKECPAVNCDVQVERATMLLEKARQDREHEHEMRLRENEALRKTIAVLRERLQSKEAEIKAINARLTASAQTVEPLVQTRQDHERELTTPELVPVAQIALSVQPKPEPRAAMKRAVTLKKTRPVTEKQPVRPQKAAAASISSFSPARRRAVETVRAYFNSELNKLRSVINTRDTLFKRYARLNPRVTFKPKKAVSSRKLTLEAIRNRISRATSVGAISVYKRDISEIKQIVNDDIAFIKRMSKKRI
ncbi:MAG: hypothetical protein D6719_12105 [Candidatus Dadabacteria bacterium]|nr:MAG: hypothetical protein D6719_12105 [Candidatus Dadabacteria bacterium]